MKKNNMIVKELIELLESFPDNLPVQIEITKDMEEGDTIDDLNVQVGGGYVIINEF